MILASFHSRNRFATLVVICAAFVVLPRMARAQGAAAADSAASAPIAPPPYSLPFQLRSAAITTAVRSDTAFAFYENPMSNNGGFTLASMLTASYKVTGEFAPLVRLGVVSNNPPDGTTAGMGTAESKFSFLNPAVGGTYLFKLSPDFRLAAFLGLTVPIGSGGGDHPNPSVALANNVGRFARSAMDNSMFAVDYFAIFPGVDLAYVNHGLTVQVEATLFQLLRVRGKGTPAGADSANTNFTAGLHAGYFIVPELSVGAELRHQRWITTPTSIKSTAMVMVDTDMLRDTTTFALGVRGHFKLGDTMWLRPGISYSRALDDPMDAANYNIVQLDVPLVF